MNDGLIFDYIGGNCPVQAEGSIDGVPFYFRARGSSWSFGVGGEPVCEPDYEYTEDYGEWPAAGWMSVDEALAFINKAAATYRASVVAKEASE